jgi:hypothetical protein
MAYISTGTRTEGPNQQPPYTTREPISTEGERARHDEKVTAEVLAGGSSLEAIGGGAAVVLSIIGLANFLPFYMAAISVIAIGGALMAHGGAMAARWRDEVRRIHGGRVTEAELAGGVGSEVFGGAAGVALGIIALAGVIPTVLLPIAVIVLGGSILFGGTSQLPIADYGTDYDARAARLGREAVQASGGVMVMAGVGAVVLGILGVLRVGPQPILTLVATLGIGGALLLGGGALTGVFARRMHTFA